MTTSRSRQLRILILLLILLFVALQQAITHWRTTNWDGTLWAVIYPINADGSEVSSDYIAQLKEQNFDSIESFFDEEATAFSLPLTHPLIIKLAPEVRSLPPAPPKNNLFAIAWWSLKTRWWAYSEDTFTDSKADIQLFVLYHDPETHLSLNHSVGIKNGGYALINAFSTKGQRGANAVIISHELLHTLGAADKYNPATGQPLHPDGYAKPDQQPLHPQQFAEIMGGRIARSNHSATIPDSLDEVLIGPQTAREINWSE